MNIPDNIHQVESNPIVGYICKNPRVEFTIAGGREHSFDIYEGDNGTFAWGPRDDAWFQVGFPTWQAAFDDAEDFYMTIAGEDYQLD